MFDIHAHLCYPEFDRDREQAVEQARAQVKGVLVSSARYQEGLCVLDLVKRHPGFLFASIGHHPTEGDRLEETIRLIRGRSREVAAIGEVGLDFHWEPDPGKRKQQKEAFRSFISLAAELGKPLVIHSWDAEQECFGMVRQARVAAAFHCFTGDPGLAEEIAREGFYVSISTNVLFSKKIRKTAKLIPLDRLLLETDSPFLDPDHSRRRNTPGNILLSAKKIAELRAIAPEEVGRAALENARRLFGLQG